MIICDKYDKIKLKNGNITINNDTYGKSKNKMTIL